MCWPNFLKLHTRVSHSNILKPHLHKGADSMHHPILLFATYPFYKFALTMQTYKRDRWQSAMSIIFCLKEYSYCSCLFFMLLYSYVGWLIYSYLNPYPTYRGSHYYQIQYIVSSTDKWSNCFM